jgi:hypothetical protein
MATKAQTGAVIPLLILLFCGWVLLLRWGTAAA